MDFEYSLENVDGRFILHSVVTTESGEKSEKNLHVIVGGSLEEVHDDMVRLSLSERLVVWVNPADLQSLVSEKYDIREFLRMDESQINNLIKVSSLFERTLLLTKDEKEKLAYAIDSCLHRTLLQDREFALRALGVDEKVFSRLPTALKHDPDFFIHAYTINPQVLRLVEKELASHPRFIDFIVEKIRSLDVDIRSIPSILFQVDDFKSALLSHPTIALRLLRPNEMLWRHLASELKNDLSFFLQVYEKNPRVLQHLDKELIDKPEFIAWISEKIAHHEIDFGLLSPAILTSQSFIRILEEQPINRKLLEELAQLNPMISDSSLFVTQLFIQKPEFLYFVTADELNKEFFQDACVLAIKQLSHDCAALGSDLKVLPFYRHLSRDLKNCKLALQNILHTVPGFIQTLIADRDLSKKFLKATVAEHLVTHLFQSDYFANIPDFDLAINIARNPEISSMQLEVLCDDFPTIGFFVEEGKMTPYILQKAREIIFRDYSLAFSDEFKENVAIRKSDLEGLNGEAIFQFENQMNPTRLKKALAQVGGIEGYSEGVELEGDFEVFYEHMIAEVSRESFSTDLAKVYSNPFEDASVAGRSDRTLLRNYRNGLPILINVGYSTSEGGHCAVLVLQGRHLMICNRGARDMKFNPLTYLEVDPAKISLEALEFLQLMIGVGNVSMQNFLLYESLQILFGKDPQNEPFKKLVEAHIKTKNQKVGNCSCASPKAAFKALAFFHYLERFKDLEPEYQVIKASKYANIDAKKMSIALRMKMEEQIKHDPGSKGIYNISRVKTMKMQLKYAANTLEEIEEITKEFYAFASQTDSLILKAIPEFDRLAELLVKKRKEFEDILDEIICSPERIFAFQLNTFQIRLNYALLTIEELDNTYISVIQYSMDLSKEKLEAIPGWHAFLEQFLRIRREYEEAYKGVLEFPHLFFDMRAKSCILRLLFQTQSFDESQELLIETFDLMTSQGLSKEKIKENPSFEYLCQLIFHKRKELLNEFKDRPEFKEMYQTLLVEISMFSLLFLEQTVEDLDQLFAVFQSIRKKNPKERRLSISNYRDFLLLLKVGYEEVGILDKRVEKINAELSL